MAAVEQNLSLKKSKKIKKQVNQQSPDTTASTTASAAEEVAFLRVQKMDTVQRKVMLRQKKNTTHSECSACG